MTDRYIRGPLRRRRQIHFDLQSREPKEAFLGRMSRRSLLPHKDSIRRNYGFSARYLGVKSPSCFRSAPEKFAFSAECSGESLLASLRRSSPSPPGFPASAPLGNVSPTSQSTRRKYSQAWNIRFACDIYVLTIETFCIILLAYAF